MYLSLVHLNNKASTDNIHLRKATSDVMATLYTRESALNPLNIELIWGNNSIRWTFAYSSSSPVNGIASRVLREKKRTRSKLRESKNWKICESLTRIVKEKEIIWTKMSPNNHIPTIQLTEAPIAISAVSEIDDTLKKIRWRRPRTSRQSYERSLRNRRGTWDSQKENVLSNVIVTSVVSRPTRDREIQQKSNQYWVDN